MSMKSTIMAAIITGSTLLSCTPSGQQNNEDEATANEVIGKVTPTITDGIMTPEILYSFGRVGEIQVSPNKSKFVYQVTYVSIDQNKTNADLFIMNTDGTGKKQLTATAARESNVRWINENEIAFLSNESGTSQIWTLNLDYFKKIQLSEIEDGIDGFNFSPDGKKVLYVKNVKVKELATDKYPDLPQASGKIVDDLMYKHWDQWVTTAPHPFVATLENGKLVNGKDLLEGEPYEAPMLPFGGMEQLAWSPDGKTIAYTSRKKTGKAYAVSTNSDIYLYNLETGETRNVTEGMMGYDTNPSFSPDGTQLAWQSMERDGYEADKNRLFVMNLQTGAKTYVTETFDYSTDSFIWNTDNQTIYLVANVNGTTQLFTANPVEKKITAITAGKHDYTSVQLIDGKLLATRQSMSSPTEIYTVDIQSGEATELSFENKEILDQLKMGEVEERWIKTTDGKQMLTWVIYPPNFDPNKKYPAILYCQGGPQNTVSQFWSYRWNMQIMAANGYIIVAPNRRGLPGFGQEWLEQISGDYSGQNMKDYLSAIDALAQEPFIDETRLGCTGASYGGYSVYWLAGNHNKRFKAFLSHAGIFNMEAQYLETEEMWFANWDMGGPYWDKTNATAQRTFRDSPHKYVDKWDTPIMVTVGELDYRILASQGMMAFNAAQLRDIPSRMLVFPDENHWITKPQNGVLFQREFFRWFDQWLKPTIDKN